MVRMRDVLKSMKDVGKRPNLEDSNESTSSGSSTGGFQFPAPSGTPREPQRGNLAQSSMPDMTKRATESSTPPKSLATLAPASQAKKDEPIVVTDELASQSPYHSAIKIIDEFLQFVKTEEPSDLDQVEEYATIFADSLTEGDQLFLQSLTARSTVTTMAQHSANVAIVAIKVALGLNFPREKIIQVGISGMVHEAGMMHISEDILNKKGSLDSSEYEMIKQHPILGRKILENVVGEHPYLPDVVAQEHERWNGNGYPFGIKEGEIHEFAQIVGMADTFVALTHMRHYRDNFIAYKAIQSIIERRNVDFSAKMIKALIDVISIFPVHSLIKLNNGSVAKVIKTNKKFPVRPIIQMLADSQGQKLSGDDEVDLSNEPMIYIVSPILDENAYL
jgi:HD-GYP domain-containing protein (c-di-GMP phosphodiesterase class II)